MASGSLGGQLNRLWYVAAIAFRGTPLFCAFERDHVNIGDKVKSVPAEASLWCRTVVYRLERSRNIWYGVGEQ